MVFKHSEYGLQYKKSHLVRNIPEYYNHVAYRTHRRELEHAHTPLSWDFETDSKSDEDVSEVPIQKLQINEECEDEEEKMCSKSEGLIQQAKDKLEKYESKDNQNTTDNKKEVCKATDDITSKADNKDETQSKEDKKDPLPSKEEKLVPKEDLKLNLKDKDKKPRKQSPKLPERPKSSPVYRPPFMAYGCGDRERETGVKRSFNVRASADVYPAAMKALINLHEQQRRRERAKKCLSARERKRKALIQEKAAKEVAGWQSEYRRMYPQYKADEYAKRASQIQDKPHAFKPYIF